MKSRGYRIIQRERSANLRLLFTGPGNGRYRRAGAPRRDDVRTRDELGASFAMRAPRVPESDRTKAGEVAAPATLAAPRPRRRQAGATGDE